MAFWNKEIISLNEKYFSLDISDLSVKVFQLEKKGGKDEIRSFGVSEIPFGCIENGEIINREKVIEIIKKLLTTAGPKKINTKKVICSLPESKVFLRAVTIPEMSKDEAAEAIKWEIEASTPLALEQVYYDWQFLDKFEGKQNVLTAAVGKDFVDKLSEILTDCGLEVCGMEVESVASTRSLIAKDAKAENIFLIVDIGSSKTSFTVTEGNIPYFTSSIPFSSSGITEEISSRMNFQKEEAEKIKITQGIENSAGNNSVLNSIGSLLENLAVEIERTMDFYQNMSKSHPEIEKIIMTGGGSNLKGLLTYLKTKISTEIVLGDPWINLNLANKLPKISQEDAMRYVVSIGLAMRETDYGD